MEVAVKFAPLMVSVKSLPPANAEAGFSEEIAGGGPAESEKLGDDEPMMVVFVELETGFEFPLDGWFITAELATDAWLLAALESEMRRAIEVDSAEANAHAVTRTAAAIHRDQRVLCISTPLLWRALDLPRHRQPKGPLRGARIAAESGRLACGHALSPHG
jgi:hypothetical protein